MSSSATSTFNYPINHNPTYHTNKDAAYILPNDSLEHTRLETQARHLSAIMNDQPIHAPIKPPGTSDMTMLDIGCGTGIVTDYLGHRFPSAKVYGLDLSPVPNRPGRPGNVSFLQGNVLTERPAQWKSLDGAFASEAELFDLIFSRLLVCGMSDWNGYVAKAFQLLNPGGYMEIHDVDWIWYSPLTSHNPTILNDSWPWWQTLNAAGRKKGLDWTCGSNAAPRMKAAGFVDVKVERYRWPWGGEWEKEEKWREFGEYVEKNITSMVWHMIPKLMGEGDWEGMREDMVRDFKGEKGKGWWLYVTVGRKPE